MSETKTVVPKIKHKKIIDDNSAKSTPLRVIIIEDFKLTRVGLRCALNSNKDIDVIAECDNALTGLELIGKYKPDVVLAGNPEAWFYGNEYLNHADHRAAARATCEAVFPSAGSRLIVAGLLTEGLEPHDF